MAKKSKFWRRAAFLFVVFTLALPAAMVSGASGPGIDSEGRMVATYGTPVMESGKIDPIWDKVPGVIPPITVPSSAKIDTTAEFKVMWDEDYLYILAIVHDNVLNKSNSNTYEQDSVEVFMDENNDKTIPYMADDVHYRVNFDNERTADDGDIDRFITVSHKTSTGYVNQIKVKWLNPSDIGKVVGFDLQVNETDSSGSRKATLNVFDDTGGAWSNTSRMGELILAAAIEDEPEPEPAVDKDDLQAQVDAAKAIDPADYENGSDLDAPLQAAEAVLADDGASQETVDQAAADLKAAIAGLKEKPAEPVFSVVGPKEISRADFLVVLVNTLGLKAEFSSNFDDVAEGTFYYEAVGIAKQIGLAAGVGDNKYNPSGNISVQDIMVLTVRALEQFHGLEKTTDLSVLDRFDDQDRISDYAQDSIATLEAEGMLVDIDSNLTPRDNSNWAQALNLLYQVSKKLAE